jgi:diketogulonate reductase-like aldo/keto reductase
MGTYKIQDEKTVVTLLKKILEIGIKHIDTARLYNKEIPLGNAINQMIK